MSEFFVEVSKEELQAAKAAFDAQIDKGEESFDVSFKYAECLVRSGDKDDVANGIAVLEDLITRGPKSERTNYKLYLAVGKAKQRNLEEALNDVREVLKEDRTNLQAMGLETEIQSQLTTKGVAGIAGFVGGALLLGWGAMKYFTRNRGDQRAKE